MALLLTTTTLLTVLQTTCRLDVRPVRGVDTSHSQCVDNQRDDVDDTKHTLDWQWLTVWLDDSLHYLLHARTQFYSYIRRKTAVAVISRLRPRRRPRPRLRLSRMPAVYSLDSLYNLLLNGLLSQQLLDKLTDLNVNFWQYSWGNVNSRHYKIICQVVKNSSQAAAEGRCHYKSCFSNGAYSWRK